MGTLFWLGYGILWLISVLGFICIVLVARYLGLQIVGTRASVEQEGPSVGSVVPPSLFGSTAFPVPSGHPTGIVFVSPDCGPCRLLLAALENMVGLTDDGSVWLIVARGKPESHLDLLPGQLRPLVRFVADERWAIGSSLKIATTPLVLLLDSEFRVLAKGRPMNETQIARLIASTRMPVQAAVAV